MLRISFAAAALIASLGVLAAPAIANAAPAIANGKPYKNCSEARANGDSDIPSSSDKYGPWLDRDGDGVGCES
jgi:Excalibur calcium-binding domain